MTTKNVSKSRRFDWRPKLRWFAAVVFAAVSCAPADPPDLLEIDPIDGREVICGCEFRLLPPDSPKRGIGSGHPILALDVNADQPAAIVNHGEGNIRLPADSFAVYNCTEGATWVVDWGSDTAAIRTELEVEGPGAEACWFSGKITFIPAGRSTNIIGACGC